MQNNQSLSLAVASIAGNAQAQHDQLIEAVTFAVSQIIANRNQRTPMINGIATAKNLDDKNKFKRALLAGFAAVADISTVKDKEAQPAAVAFAVELFEVAYLANAPVAAAKRTEEQKAEAADKRKVNAEAKAKEWAQANGFVAADEVKAAVAATEKKQLSVFDVIDLANLADLQAIVTAANNKIAALQQVADGQKANKQASLRARANDAAKALTASEKAAKHNAAVAAKASEAVAA